DARVPAASPPSYTETSGPAPTPTLAGDAALGSAPEDLRDMDWAHTAVPGDFCQVPEPIRFTSGEATVRSERWGTVHAEQRLDTVVYGGVLGDSRAEAALLVGCDT